MLASIKPLASAPKILVFDFMMISMIGFGLVQSASFMTLPPTQAAQYGCARGIADCNSYCNKLESDHPFLSAS
jgi:hypothetical protein